MKIKNMISDHTTAISKYQICKYAVIGGGMSGLYTAKRLAENYPEEEIVLIEKSGMVGGRLKSEFFEGIDIPVELGGMRFTDGHKLVRALVKEYNLEVDKFDFELTAYILRGKCCKKKTFTDDIKEIFPRLEPHEKGKTPSELIDYAIEKNLRIKGYAAMHEEDKVTELKEKITANVFKDRHLHDVHWTFFLRKALSSEAVKMIEATEGYNSNLDNMSAFEGLRELGRFDEPFLHLKKGYQQLPQQLAKSFSDMGGHIMLRKKVEKIRKHNYNSTDDRIRKIFEELSNSKQTVPQYYIRMLNEINGETEYILCDKIILAMPKNAIKKLDWHAEGFKPPQYVKALDVINSVHTMKSLKIYINFSHNWWHEHHLDKKKIYTDGAIRMAYFLGNGALASPDNTASLMLVYVDQKAAEELQVPEMYRATNCLRDGKSSMIVDFLHDNLKDLIRKYTDGQDEEIASITEYAYMQWEEAYHCFPPTVNVFETIRSAIKPAEEYEVYICGSSYSSMQSWVEGALLTSEFMLNEYFGLQFNANVPTNYVKDKLFT